MKKREFIKHGTILTVGALTVPLSSCNNSGTQTGSIDDGSASKTFTPFELPELPYEKSALEPYIDQMTMEIHHDRHHAGYVKKLNAALSEHSLAGNSLSDIMSSLTENDTAVRNNGGGHYNHSLFWKVMGGGENQGPSGMLLDAINGSFDSFDKFKDLFSMAAAKRFGSGWAWLSVDANNKLFISSTPNQDNPMMKNLVDQPGTPILGIDVWEHAYYLKYQNKRTEYISNFFNVINWDQVAANLGSIS